MPSEEQPQRRIWKGIVLHHTAGRDTTRLEADNIWRLHVHGNGWLNTGYHRIVERLEDGRYYSVNGRPLFMHGAHSPPVNQTHLGVALVGNFEAERAPDDAIEAVAIECASLCAVTGVPSSEIYPHNRFRSTACPGLLAGQIPEIKRQVQALLDEWI